MCHAIIKPLENQFFIVDFDVIELAGGFSVTHDLRRQGRFIDQEVFDPNDVDGLGR